MASSRRAAQTRVSLPNRGSDRQRLHRPDGDRAGEKPEGKSRRSAATAQTIAAAPGSAPGSCRWPIGRPRRRGRARWCATAAAGAGRFFAPDAFRANLLLDRHGPTRQPRPGVRQRQAHGKHFAGRRTQRQLPFHRSPRSVDRTARQLINTGQNIIPARISSRLTSFETAPPKTISTIAT